LNETGFSFRHYLEAEADKLATQWLTEYRVAIKSLSDDR
jgi:hypothetical protein